MWTVSDGNPSSTGRLRDGNVPSLYTTPPFIADLIHTATGMRMKVRAAGSEVKGNTTGPFLTWRTIGVPFHCGLKVFDVIHVHN